MGQTSIEWATHTINFYDWACRALSPGCDNCYARALATRHGRTFDKTPEWRDNGVKEWMKVPAGSVARSIQHGRARYAISANSTAHHSCSNRDLRSSPVKIAYWMDALGTKLPTSPQLTHASQTRRQSLDRWTYFDDTPQR